VQKITCLSRHKFIDIFTSMNLYGFIVLFDLPESLYPWTPAWFSRPERITFNFNATEIQQRNQILSFNHEITGKDLPTYIFLEIKQ
jgi:hypothetical protein